MTRMYRTHRTESTALVQLPGALLDLAQQGPLVRPERRRRLSSFEMTMHTMAAWTVCPIEQTC